MSFFFIFFSPYLLLSLGWSSLHRVLFEEWVFGSCLSFLLEENMEDNRSERLLGLLREEMKARLSAAGIRSLEVLQNAAEEELQEAGLTEVARPKASTA